MQGGGNINLSVTGGTGAIDTTAGSLFSNSSQEMEERSPSQRLAVTYRRDSLLPKEKVRSRQQIRQVSLPFLWEEMEERSNCWR
jgi:hypothetical protein